MTPERLATIKSSLDKRQTDLTVVMENVRKPHNLAAVARTLEAVGGLEIHAITSLTSIRLTQMSAGGTKKWMKVNKHPNTKQGLEYLKQQGFQIIATTLADDSKDYREVDGLMLPHVQRQSMMGMNQTMKIKSYEINAAIDDAVFEIK